MEFSNPIQETSEIRYVQTQPTTKFWTLTLWGATKFLLLTEYYFRDHIKTNEMGVWHVCEKGEVHIVFWWENLKKIHHLEEISIDGRIIHKMDLTGLKLPGLGQGHLAGSCTLVMNFQLLWNVTSRKSEKLSASQEEICSMELLSLFACLSGLDIILKWISDKADGKACLQSTILQTFFSWQIPYKS